MRGKLLSLTLIAAMLGTFLVGIGHGQTPFTVYADPPLITGLLGGDSFEVNIWITGGEAIYAWEFAMSYPGFVQQVSVIDVVEGDFLKTADVGYGTYMAKYVNPYEGYMSASGTLLGDSEGAYGDGILATVRFTIIEPAGEFPLDVLYAKLFVRFDSELIEIDPADITVLDSYFLGPSADLLLNPGEDRTSNVWRVGFTRRFHSVVYNPGYAPVWARARYTSVRGDGRTVTLYGGQHMYTTVTRGTEYYYVNDFVQLTNRWTTTGDSPWLDAADGTNYVTGDIYCRFIGMFHFEDITLSPGDIIYTVRLQGLCRVANIDIDIDVYDYPAFNWYGSWWGTPAWAWQNPRWLTDRVDQVNPAVRTQAGFNAFSVLLHYYTPDGSPMGPADVDALRLVVTSIGMDPRWVGGTYIPAGNPGKALDKAFWDLWPFDVGTYTTTCEIEYRWGTPDPRFPQYWATAPTVSTFTWTAHP